MKACFLLLHYLMTWVRPLKWIAGLGLALLVGAVAIGLTGRATFAFGLSIYAFVCLFAIPYLGVWHVFRTLLGSRRLSMLPAFRLHLWLALLLLHLLLAAFLPLSSILLGPDIDPLRTAVAVFLATSLGTFLLQWTVASRYAIFVYSFGPFVLIYVFTQAWPLVFFMFYDAERVFALIVASALGWGLALYAMTSRRDFHPPRKTPLHFRDYVWEGRSDWLGVLLGNYKGTVKSADGTLLTGAPDSLAGRFFLGVNVVLISPLMGVLLLSVIGFGGPANRVPDTLAGMFLTFSMTTCLIGGFANGDTVARYRLLWLRLAGSRPDYWRHLERQLAAGTGLLALIVIPITGVTLMLFDAITFDPLWYCAGALAGNVLANYFSLAARLRHWSFLVQILVATGMTIGFVIASVLDLLPLPVMVALAIGLTLLFRQQALQSFSAVDWQQLRPASQTFKGKPA
jgi:hypothetical protein